MRRQTPDADRVGHRPGPPPVSRFRLQGLTMILRILVADMHDNAAIGCLAGVQLVVLAGAVVGTHRNVREPMPGLSVIRRLADPDLVPGLPELLPGIEQTSVGQSRWSVWAI